MSVAARVRLVLARSPWLYWAIVAALAAGAGLLVMRAASDVEAARDAWGETRTVAVAVVDIELGSSLDGAVESRDLPAPMVPAAAVEDVADGAVARQRIGAGEVVLEHDVAATGIPQSLIHAGWLAVAVSEPVPSGAVVGDAVSVASGGVVLAGEGVVVGVTGEAVVVAVPEGDAPQVAQAASTGDIALLLKP